MAVSRWLFLPENNAITDRLARRLLPVPLGERTILAMIDSNNLPADADAPLDELDLTSKDSAYSPSSERETQERQAEHPVDIDGVKQLPGTGGPDDGGDVTIPNDEINAQTIVERSDPGKRPTGLAPRAPE